MATSNKPVQYTLISAIGVLIMGISLVGINAIAKYKYFRIDFTKDKLYTLSEGSRKILMDIETPVTIRLYYSEQASAIPMQLKVYGERVKDLLQEYKIAGEGAIKIKIYDPLPDSDAEDVASLDGVDGQMLPSGEKFYLGLAVSSLDNTLSLPFLSPENEDNLEYDITRLIYRVINTEKIVIGVLSSLPVFGEKAPPPMGIPRQQRNSSPPWLFISELKKDYEVKKFATNIEVVPDDVKILIVAHPKDISEKALFAVDQFILRGGKLIACLDPFSIIDARLSPPSMMGGPSMSSSLKTLLDAWGVTFDEKKIVADRKYRTTLSSGGGQQQKSSLVLSFSKEGINQEDIISNALESLIIPYSGSFSGDIADGITKTALITSSVEAQEIDAFKAQISPEMVEKNFSPDNKNYELAIRLTGTFKTAFPDGVPKEEKEDSDGDNQEEDKKVPDNSSFKQSQKDTTVILVADADFLYDDFWVRKMGFLGQVIHNVFSDNNSFLQNAVEQLSGDNRLISIRSRRVIERPFDVVRDMEIKAEKKYQEEISKLEKELTETKQKINELQRTKGDQNQRFILSDEQQKELERFQKKKAEMKPRLKKLRKQLNGDIDSLEMRLRLYNIALMPILVILAGVTVAIRRARRR